MRSKTILIQNYHPPATAALIRDFKKIGFEVLSPDSNWGPFMPYSPNDGLGGKLISESEYFARPPGYVLITCKPAEDSLKSLARKHNDLMILNVAQQHMVYEVGISDIMICPDIDTHRNYPETIKHKLLYFMRPHMGEVVLKDCSASFASKAVNSFTSIPHVWPLGSAAMTEFKSRYPFSYQVYGYDAPGGHLDHASTNRMMAASFFTAQFKDMEAYGLACIESMMLGTPIVTLERFVSGRTLGEFFLDDSNAIIATDVEGIVGKLLSLTLNDYVKLSENAKARLRSDE